MADQQQAFTVLLVCTGNICRSPLAERLGRAFLRELRADLPEAIQLASAGTRAVVGSAMHPDSALVLQGLGAEPGDFRARQFDSRMAADADLVLTMTRDHRRHVLRTAPRALQRTFTLLEARELLGLLDPRLQPAGDDGSERARGLVRELAAARTRRQAGGDGGQHDVPDPIGRPVGTHEAVGEAIATSLLPLLTRIADLTAPTSDDTAGRHAQRH